jgi:hypothetical protein
MKKHSAILTSILLLALFSCNKGQKENNTAVRKSDTVSKTKEKFKRESFKEDVKNLSGEILQFVPKDYAVLDTASGDLNLDNIKDLILVLKRNGEDTLSDVVDNPEKRPLLILLGDINHKLTLAKKNDNTVYCIDCGGMMGDPYMGITIKNGYFSVEHYGGSGWRWSRIITYKYSKQENEWFLHKDGSESFNVCEPEKVESTIRTAKDFGKVRFEEFDIYKDE